MNAPSSPTNATLPLGDGLLWTTSQHGIPPIPTPLRPSFAPAEHCLYEWTPYWVEHPHADRLRMGDGWATLLRPGLFEVRFENQLGLASLQPFAGTKALSTPLWVEVISPKFDSPQKHLNFYRALLDDLYARAARLPFAFSADTSRAVRESPRPPTPLFTLHYLLQYGPGLRRALATVLGAPHRQLQDHPAHVPLHEASEADADVLIGILHSPEELAPARGFPLARKLGNRAPARVWQRLPVETFDTPPNRFVLSFLRELLAAAQDLPRQGWWGGVSAERRAAVLATTGALRQAVAHGMWAEVGPMHSFPSASQVLLRREGYRDMLELWQLYHRARRPIFEPLRHAIDVRDVATMYEVWAYFALVEEIAASLGVSPALDLRQTDQEGLGWASVARFGDEGSLHYNRSFTRSKGGSYSVPLRPDFTWMRGGVAQVVLDAKFRFDRTALDPDDDTPHAAPKRADLYKMHTYRDALGVRAAVTIYPGTEAMFYDQATHLKKELTLKDLLEGSPHGIGALPLSPAPPVSPPASPHDPADGRHAS